jgi:hypothetical protein
MRCVDDFLVRCLDDFLLHVGAAVLRPRPIWLATRMRAMVQAGSTSARSRLTEGAPQPSFGFIQRRRECRQPVTGCDFPQKQEPNFIALATVG